MCVGFLLSLTPLGFRPRDTLLPLGWWRGSGLPGARLRKESSAGSLRGHGPDPGGHLRRRSGACGVRNAEGAWQGCGCGGNFP